VLPITLGASNAPVRKLLVLGARRRRRDRPRRHHPSQRHRPWFRADTFWSVMRLRGIESNSPTGYAEGFYVRKVVLPGGEAAAVDHHAHPKPS
jgi:hypothetical protein